jgi:VWFA-related protein
VLGKGFNFMKRVLIAACLLFALQVAVGVTGISQSRHNRVSNTTATTVPDSVKPRDVNKDPDESETSTLPGKPGGETLEGDVLTVDTSLVTVPVSVMDRNGKYLPDLERDSFHIFEDGVEQKLSYFATVDQPFTVALIIDTSRSTHFKLEDIQNSAITFVQQLKPADRVMVLSFDDQINVLAEPTGDREELARAIRRTRTGGSTRLYDAVDFIINRRLNHIPGRKAVVLFTDGVDTTSRNATYESTVRDAEELDALIYTVEYDTSRDIQADRGNRRVPGGRGGVSIGLPFPFPGTGGGGGGRGGGSGRGGGNGPGRSPGSSRGDYAKADAYLHELPEKTGARFYNGNTLLDVSNAFAQVADELRRQYSLGYYPKAGGQDGARRQIKVRVDQANAVVNARDSYIYTQKKPDPGRKNGQEFSKRETPVNRAVASR